MCTKIQHKKLNSLDKIEFIIFFISCNPCNPPPPWNRHFMLCFEEDIFTCIFIYLFILNDIVEFWECCLYISNLWMKSYPCVKHFFQIHLKQKIWRRWPEYRQMVRMGECSTSGKLCIQILTTVELLLFSSPKLFWSPVVCHLSVKCSHSISYSRTTRPIQTKLSTMHSRVMGIQISSNKGSHLFRSPESLRWPIAMGWRLSSCVVRRPLTSSS